jgi:hypothetical protein
MKLLATATKDWSGSMTIREKWLSVVMISATERSILVSIFRIDSSIFSGPTLGLAALVAYVVAF